MADLDRLVSMQNSMAISLVSGHSSGEFDIDNLSSSSASSQRSGRTKRSGLPARQYMFFGQ